VVAKATSEPEIGHITAHERQEDGIRTILKIDKQGEGGAARSRVARQKKEQEGQDQV